MTLESRGMFLGCTVIAVACLVGAASAAQNAQEDPPMAGDVFENVVLLRDIPVDTFFETMGMFANSMGNDCTFCHSSTAVFDKAAFAEIAASMSRTKPSVAGLIRRGLQDLRGRLKPLD